MIRIGFILPIQQRRQKFAIRGPTLPTPRPGFPQLMLFRVIARYQLGTRHAKLFKLTHVLLLSEASQSISASILVFRSISIAGGMIRCADRGTRNSTW